MTIPIMPPEPDDSSKELCYIFTREEADRLVTEALDTDLDEPEPFVRMLLILLDNARENRLKDAIQLLIKVAYDGSIVHSIAIDEYIEAVREGRNILEEVRARWLDHHKSEA
jgi:hypothetical protein